MCPEEPRLTDTTADIDDRIAPTAFRDAFQTFERLIVAHDQGHPFSNFDEGIAGAEEGYKLPLRRKALDFLQPETWTVADIGRGEILTKVIAAIEIQDSRGPLTNNLVFWQNRFGPQNQDHRRLIEAQQDAESRRRLESLFYRLYRDDGAIEGEIFDELGRITGGKYPLLAYLFFLHDPARFSPIQPTTYDRAFRNLGVPLTTVRHCTWDNYRRFNAVLEQVRRMLTELAGLPKARLIDAHSLLWILETFQKPDGAGRVPPRKNAARIVGGIDKSIIAMRYSIRSTVNGSNGQTVERTLKNKLTSLSDAELDQHLAYLLAQQDNHCALTGLTFDFHSEDGDRMLRPSPDRIDSSGHYEPGNLQVVCQFINFWKGSQPNSEFKRLLALVKA